MPDEQGVVIWTKSFLAVHDSHPAATYWIIIYILYLLCRARVSAKEVFFMNILIKSFTDSAKEFKNLKSVVTAALLVAVHTVMAVFLSITVTQSLRISISFLTNVVTGALFGPIVGMLCGGIGDIVQYIIKPTGAYFPGFTISAMLSGFIYGLAYYNRFPRLKDNDKHRAVTEKKGFANDDSVFLGKRNAIILKVCTGILPIAGIIVWFMMPFVEVADKKTQAIVVSGSAFNIVRNMSVCKNAAVIAIIILVVFVLSFVLNIWSRHTIPAIFMTIGCFIGGLSMYTDKKFTTVLSGYWIISAIMVLYIAIQLFIMSKRSELDVRFAIRCVIAMSVVNILVNGVLGTYWVTILYGKGFWFYFTSRMIKNIVQLPVNIVLTYYVLGFVGNIKKKGAL